MTTALDEQTAARVAEFIHEAIATALTSYQKYALKDTAGMLAKEFTEHHKALRAAAAHLELLLKLEKMITKPPARAIEDKSGRDDVLHHLVAEAKSELLAYQRLPVIDAEFSDVEDDE